MATTQLKKEPRPVEYDVEDEAIYDTRMPSSARRYRPSQPIPRYQPDDATTGGVVIPKRRASQELQSGSGMVERSTGPKTGGFVLEKLSLQHMNRNFPLISVLVGVVATIVLIMGLSAFSSWWQVYQDDLHYGRPRTFQMDAVVGHNDSRSNPTHFIFLNLHRHIEIIEIPGGDAAHTRLFTGPILFGDGQDLTPVTGEIKDVNGDKKPDLIVHIQNQQMIFLNDGTTFRPK